MRWVVCVEEPVSRFASYWFPDLGSTNGNSIVHGHAFFKRTICSGEIPMVKQPRFMYASGRLSKVVQVSNVGCYFAPPLGMFPRIRRVIASVIPE